MLHPQIPSGSAGFGISSQAVISVWVGLLQVTMLRTYPNTVNTPLAVEQHIKNPSFELVYR